MVVTCDKNQFVPYTLNITVETQREQNMLQNLMSNNVQIPNFLYEEKPDRDYLASLMQKVFDAIPDKKRGRDL